MMAKALLQARLALEEGEFPVGCVIVEGDRILAQGRRKNSAAKPLSELDHAEIVAMRSMQASGQAVDFSRAVVYSTMEPCLMCYATLLLNGFTTIVYAYEDVMGGGASLAFDSLPPFYQAMRVKIVAGVGRQESLELFRRFFAQPGNAYLKNSELCRYTLAQK